MMEKQITLGIRDLDALTEPGKVGTLNEGRNVKLLTPTTVLAQDMAIIIPVEDDAEKLKDFGQFWVGHVSARMKKQVGVSKSYFQCSEKSRTSGEIGRPRCLSRLQGGSGARAGLKPIPPTDEKTLPRWTVTT